MGSNMSHRLTAASARQPGGDIDTQACLSYVCREEEEDLLVLFFLENLLLIGMTSGTIFFP
jgi:hypothetical protein